MKSFDEFECKEQKDFESFMMRYKPEFRDFEKVGESTYSNTLTSIAYDSYLAGQQSKQAEVDELRKRIGEAINVANESCGVSVADFVRLNRILKGNKDD